MLNNLYFPHPTQTTKDGLLAVGGDLTVERLLLAYQYGIFPWYSENEPIMWWSPDPRFVLFPEDIIISKSMNNYFNQKKYSVTINQKFESVVSHCRTIKRKGQNGTWITSEIKEAYSKLHDMGKAHSVEVWEGESLVGGLYGVCIGKVFFGESMFSLKSNASKYGFISLVKQLSRIGCWMIDCQVPSEHLYSLGASTIPRNIFLEILHKNMFEDDLNFDLNFIL
jgi:leucyl/phenylalanyl-tRNA--protein transferase